MEVWEADADGLYDVQYTGDRVANRAHLFTGNDGGYRFWSVRPAPYPIPHDGPVGDLLVAAGRGPMRPAHIHFMVSAYGYETLTTHVFADGDPNLGQDAVFGVKPSLIRSFAQRPAGIAPDGREMSGTWCRVDFDITLGAMGPMVAG
jgi:hydroxyquinol 1,2-dioxygenase